MITLSLDIQTAIRIGLFEFLEGRGFKTEALLLADYERLLRERDSQFSGLRPGSDITTNAAMHPGPYTGLPSKGCDDYFAKENPNIALAPEQPPATNEDGSLALRVALRVVADLHGWGWCKHTNDMGCSRHSCRKCILEIVQKEVRREIEQPPAVSEPIRKGE